MAPERRKDAAEAVELLRRAAWNLRAWTGHPSPCSCAKGKGACLQRDIDEFLAALSEDAKE